ncbi:UvrD-helicase domain-containing protein [Halobacteriales archaeon Cl-PHB]
MSEPTPNDQQQDLIDSTEGIYCVDAGAGTGKTFAITRRYASIVDQAGVEPDDVLLGTFTESAATEMKERIVTHSSYSVRELADAPIQTFHSRCWDLLREHGHRAPTHLGIDDRITASTRIVEDDLVESAHFREFFGRFRDAHPEHDQVLKVLDGPDEVLSLVKELAATGIFPTTEGWYRDGAERMTGDRDLFREQFDAANEPRNDGRKQSELRSGLSGFGRNKCYRTDAPAKTDVRGSGTKQVPADVAERVFDEDREALVAFVHDVYLEYLEFALSRNYLNFAFLQLFAFVLLCEDHDLREKVAFEYVMIDEFQDTSEIQFKLALLIAGTGNFCVVGDWKQSIFSFQYAAVENITDFEARLERFASELNSDAERVGFDPRPVETIELRENYRSTETILEYSEETLLVPASSSETVDTEPIQDDIVSLESNAAFDNTRIEAIKHEDEHEAVLTKIQAIVGNDDYAVEDEDGNPRAPTLGDITVLTRTRDYGRELLDVADEYDIPLAYDGGVELLRTDAAKLLLAWLRILEDDGDRGWAVVLERAGYTLDEIDHLLDSGAYPAAMVEFREELRDLETIGAVARRVFARYGFEGVTADVLLDTIASIHRGSTLTRGDLIQFIEQGIEDGTTHEVHTSAGTNAVTVQTIHAAKGREYPIVILANMNEHRFPPSGGTGGVLQYSESAGLRQRKLYGQDHGHPHVYDNWRWDVLRRCLPDSHDEERRLLYVATTRAKSHVVYAAGESPNAFLEGLPTPIESYDPAVEAHGRATTAQTELPITVPTPEGPVGHTPHTIMQDDVFAEVEDGRGTTFGQQVHDFAEAYALGEAVEPKSVDERNVRDFLDSLEGELIVEKEARLPLSVDGTDVCISGVIDLLHVLPDRVEIVDYKTDLGRHAEDEYCKQLSVYYHIVESVYPDREVSASIFYTHDGERQDQKPLSRDELEGLLDELV